MLPERSERAVVGVPASLGWTSSSRRQHRATVGSCCRSSCRSTAMLAPNSIVFEDKELTMFSFTQLEQLSLKILRSRAWAMRDQVGADRLPPVPQNNEAIVMWILDTQTAISRVVGQEYTIYDFGYPKHGLPTVDGSFFDPQPAMGELPHEYPPARRAKRAPLPCPQARNVRRYATSVRQFQVRTPPPTRRWSAPSTRLPPLATLPRKGRAAPASSERPLSACIACKRGGCCRAPALEAAFSAFAPNASCFCMGLSRARSRLRVPRTRQLHASRPR